VNRSVVVVKTHKVLNRLGCFRDLPGVLQLLLERCLERHNTLVKGGQFRGMFAIVVRRGKNRDRLLHNLFQEPVLDDMLAALDGL
jgi:hypothetical protein